MSFAETRYEHIVLDDQQVPIIGDANMKVIELVKEHLAWGWSPEELQYQHPYLTMGQIHSALAYYWDHKEELDADIARRSAFADQMRREAPPSPFVARLRVKGLLPVKEEGEQNK